ncbi:MAG: phosphoribosylaminoimidazolesuccinocarboxamide synthase [Leptospiraceae bacterium]|nr:phosphoribosylaminoimidazolesuccinocarboxamide synthase [Leptospiraceae bacterium]MCP5495044.1 phosphoribosylaminoimidazolesuccinocarboxamide synthase [Leptospiraceae bacterium]
MKPTYNGKVRDVYDLRDKLILHSTDRISAFDVVFREEIKNKGKILNNVSIAWFGYFKNYPNHIIETNFEKFPPPYQANKEFQDSAVLVKKCQRIDFECIVRGYLYGSAYKEYLKTGKVSGITLGNGLKEAEILPEPIFTPSTKNDTGHDENITEEEMKNQVGNEIFEKIKTLSLEIYSKAQKKLKEIGILLCDTKLEFGIYQDEIILIDELLTPDSSRYWNEKTYQKGKTPESFDKQILRNYLEEIKWSKTPPPPPLPTTIINEISEKYHYLQDKLLQCLLEK